MIRVFLDCGMGTVSDHNLVFETKHNAERQKWDLPILQGNDSPSLCHFHVGPH